jgi:hypothetical protein
VAPELTVICLATAAAVIVGILVVPELMTTSDAAVGTVAGFQFEAVPQVVLVPPTQKSCAFPEYINSCIIKDSINTFSRLLDPFAFFIIFIGVKFLFNMEIDFLLIFCGVYTKRVGFGKNFSGTFRVNQVFIRSTCFLVKDKVICPWWKFGGNT